MRLIKSIEFMTQVKGMYRIVFIFIFFILVSCCKDFEKQYSEAKELYEKKDQAALFDAVEKYDEAIQIAVKSMEEQAMACRALGHLLFKHGHYKKAIEFLEKSSDLDGRKDLSYYLLALSYMNLAKQTETVQKKVKQLIKEALEMAPHSYETLYIAGLYHWHVKKDALAGIQYLKKSLSVDSNNPRGQLILAGIFFHMAEKKITDVLHFQDLGLDSAKVERVKEESHRFREKARKHYIAVIEMEKDFPSYANIAKKNLIVVNQFFSNE